MEDTQSKKLGSFLGRVFWITMGSEQYLWRTDGPNSHADPDGPPLGRTVQGGPQVTYLLPKSSITILRGKVGDL